MTSALHAARRAYDGALNPKNRILAELDNELARLGHAPSQVTTENALLNLRLRILNVNDVTAVRIAVAACQLSPGSFPPSGFIDQLYRERAKVPILPAFAKSSRNHQARVVLGAKPVDFFPGLTTKEAHDALVLGSMTSMEYVLRDVMVWREQHQGPPMPLPVRTLGIAKWVAACFSDERWATLATFRKHLVRGVDGAPGIYAHDREEKWRYLERLDEIEEVDLDRDHPLSTGVRAAFEASAARLARQNAETIRRHTLQSYPEAASLIPRWWKPIRAARLLTTPEELSAEGREMRHCVGNYYSRVATGASIIVAIRVPQRKYTEADAKAFTQGFNSYPVHPSLMRRMVVGSPVGRRTAVTWRRSTVEYSPEGRRVQHYGPGNSHPHILCERALRVCEKRWGLANIVVGSL